MSNKDENGVSRWWLREPVDHADAESDKGGDFVMHSDYRRVVDALKDELAGTIKVREAAFVQIARLKADLSRVRGQRDRLAIDMKHSIHADRLFCGSSDAKRESAEIMESEYGLRIENGEVKEIEG